MTEIGTLQQLNVKPGDVVADACGLEAKVVMHDGCICVIYDHWNKPEERNDYGKYRVIYRAADTPKLWRDMTPEEKGALLLAQHEGKVIEYRIGDAWHHISFPNFNPVHAYRVKPEPTVETVKECVTIAGRMETVTYKTTDGVVDRSTIEVVK